MKAQDFEKLAQLNNEAYIQSVYQYVMGREADAEGLKYWMNAMDAGITREWVFFELRLSEEGRHRNIPVEGFRMKEIDLEVLTGYENEVFVESAWLCLIGRHADERNKVIYLNVLESSIWDKMDVIINLRGSLEGQTNSVKVTGLDEALADKRRNEKMPAQPVFGNAVGMYWDFMDINRNVTALEQMCIQLSKLQTESMNELIRQNMQMQQNMIDLTKQVREMGGEISRLKDELNRIGVRERCRLRSDSRLFLQNWAREHTGERMIIVSNYYPPHFCGGAEIIAHRQGMAMAAEGLMHVMAVSVIVKDQTVPGDHYIEMVDDIPVLRICVSGENFNGQGINFYDEMVNEIFDELCEMIRPVAVHCHNLIGTSLGIVDIAHEWGARVIVTLHDHWGFCFKNTCLDNKGDFCDHADECEACMPALTAGGIRIPISARRQYFRRVFEKMDALISPSRYLAMSYIGTGVDEHKMHVISNGIDTERYSSIVKKPSDHLRITYVGTFGMHKGVANLISAVGRIKDDNIVLNLVGSGEEEDNYKKIASEYDIMDQIVFWGKVSNDDVIRVYEETDILCLPSIWPENQPVSITEAMACGIPVIASDIGGNRELVEDGVTGRRFKAGNVDALADMIKEFLGDRALISRMGEAGRAAMAENSFGQQVRKICELYREQTSDRCQNSRNILAVKGLVWPDQLSECTSSDVLLFDWISEAEDRQIKAVLVVEDTILNGREIQRIEKYRIPLILAAGTEEKYKNIKTDLYTYHSSKELNELIAFVLYEGVK